jgi:hypothetical protein
VTFQVWNADWAPLSGKAVFDRAAQQVTAISRAPGNLDLFIIGNDGGPGNTNGHFGRHSGTAPAAGTPTGSRFPG